MKPTLALHIGMPKTGSSAMQTRLAASHKSLAAAGVLYPMSTIAHAHHFLVFPLDFARSGPRLLTQRIGRDDRVACAIFDADWQRLDAAIARSQPQVVILSSEYLFSRAGLPGHRRLFDRISATFTDVRVVAYVRQPPRPTPAAPMKLHHVLGRYPLGGGAVLDDAQNKGVDNANMVGDMQIKASYRESKKTRKPRYD